MKLTKSTILLFCFVLTVQWILPSFSHAKLYTWTDRNGNVRRTYYPPPSDQVLKDNLSGQRSTEQKKISRNQVDLYVTSWCPYCKQAIQYFQSKGVKINVYDIEKNKNAAARKKKLDKNSGVPFAVVNGTRIHGYNPELYAKALK